VRRSYCTVLPGIIVREGGRSSNRRRLWLVDAPPSLCLSLIVAEAVLDVIATDRDHGRSIVLGGRTYDDGCRPVEHGHIGVHRIKPASAARSSTCRCSFDDNANERWNRAGRPFIACRPGQCEHGNTPGWSRNGSLELLIVMVVA
jgi:hypothetical protein